jgi:cytochrome c-type biogenesis protein CcmH
MSAQPAPLAKLKAQLAQLDQLIAEGTLKGADAKARRDELERQVLAAVTGGAAAGPAAEPAERLPRRLLAGVGVFVLAVGLIGYAAKGNRDGWSVGPGEAVATEGEGAGHSTRAAQLEEMTQRLAERLKAAPDDAEGWSMLARSYTAQGKFNDALPAFKRVVELRPQDAQALADYADGLAVVNNRSLEGEPEKLIAQALKIDPANVKALSLAGTVSFNKNDFAAAAGLWERALKGADPASDFTRQLQAAVNEARQRAGLPPLAAAEAAAAPVAVAPAAKPAAPSAAAAGATITGRVTLGAATQGKVSPDDTVFIFARAPTGSRMPLAILRKKVSELPLDFKLDDSLAMSPAANLSSAPEVVVGARISKSGSAVPQPGDWQALSAPMKPGATGVNLEINQPAQ